MPTDFEANPLAGAAPSRNITGSGAKLQPDALATGTGTVSAGDERHAGIARYQFEARHHINDGVNSLFTYTSTRLRHGRQFDQRNQFGTTGGSRLSRRAQRRQPATSC